MRVMSRQWAAALRAAVGLDPDPDEARADRADGAAQPSRT